MPKATKTAKSNRIEAERARLYDIFKDLDANKLSVAQTLIDRAAFITISLEDIEAELNKRSGWTEEYLNGPNQNGRKKSAAADVHISLTKNLTAITKQLLELVPAAVKASKLAALRDE